MAIGVYRLRANYPQRRKLRVQLYPVGTVLTGSGSASFNITSAAGGAADVAGSGSVSFRFTAEGVSPAYALTKRLTLTGTSKHRYMFVGTG